MKDCWFCYLEYMHPIILCFTSYYGKYSLFKIFVFSYAFATKYILSVTLIETIVSLVFAFTTNLRVSL